MRLTLQRQLKQAGLDTEAWLFREYLADLAAAMFPGWKDERITYNPKTAAIPFCDAVRAHYRACEADLPDEMILAALHNIRKHAIKV